MWAAAVSSRRQTSFKPETCVVLEGQECHACHARLLTAGAESLVGGPQGRGWDQGPEAEGKDAKGRGQVLARCRGVAGPHSKV